MRSWRRLGSRPTRFLFGCSSWRDDSLGLEITTMGRVMLAENRAQFSLAECVYAGLLSKGRSKKPKASVIIVFSSPEYTNRAVDLGLVWKGLRHNAELYDIDCKLLQCAKSLHWRYGSRRRASAICALYVEAHFSHVCPIATSLPLNRNSDALCLEVCCMWPMQSSDPWVGGAFSMDRDPINWSLQILVDPVIRLVEENPWAG